MMQRVKCSYPFSSGWFRFLDCLCGFMTLVESYRHFNVTSHVRFLCDKNKQNVILTRFSY